MAWLFRDQTDARLPADELRGAWTVAVVLCAAGAWVTPYLTGMNSLPGAASPWWAGGRTPLSMALGALLLIPGILLALASVRALGRGAELVSIGPYRFMRHPYLLAVLLLLAGIIVALRSLPALVLFLPVVRLTNERARREEHNLELRFGEAYRAYRRRVPFLLPLAPPLPPGGMAAARPDEIRLGLADEDDGESRKSTGEDQ